MGAWLRWLPLAVLALRRANRLAPHPIGTTSISQFIMVGYLKSLAGAQRLLGNTIAANICGRRGNAGQPLLSKKQRDGEKSFRQK